MREINKDLEQNIQNSIQQILSGNLSRFERLMQAYEGGLFALARRFFHHTEDAEEALQEIYIKIYRNLEKFRGESKFYTWAYRIAMNCCINLYNKQKNRLKTQSLDHSPLEEGKTIEIPDHSNNPEKTAIDNVAVQNILHEIDKLPPKYSSVLILREWHEFSYEEIAQIEDSSLSSVKTRIRRGRLMLINRLSAPSIRRKHNYDPQ